MTCPADYQPLDTGDVPLDELLCWREQWPPATETDPARIAIVRDVVSLGLLAAKLALGISHIERRGDDTFVCTVLDTDCPHCLAGRSKQQLAAEYALIVAEQFTTLDDCPDPVAARNEIDWNLKLIVAACDDARDFRKQHCCDTNPAV